MSMHTLSLIILQIACFATLQAQADTHPAVMDGLVHKAPHSSCQVKENAESEAKDLAVKSVKTYCRSEGFGWRASTVKSIGNLECHRCEDNRFKCGYSEITLECRKAGPQLSLLELISAQR